MQIFAAKKCFKIIFRKEEHLWGSLFFLSAFYNICILWHFSVFSCVLTCPWKPAETWSQWGCRDSWFQGAEEHHYCMSSQPIQSTLREATLLHGAEVPWIWNALGFGFAALEMHVGSYPQCCLENWYWDTHCFSSKSLVQNKGQFCCELEVQIFRELFGDSHEWVSRFSPFNVDKYPHNKLLQLTLIVTLVGSLCREVEY